MDTFSAFIGNLCRSMITLFKLCALIKHGLFDSWENSILQLQDTGFTALMFACKGGHGDTVSALLKHSANPAIKNKVKSIQFYDLDRSRFVINYK